MVKKQLKKKPVAKPSDADGTDSFSAYTEYNKILRTWFVAYGIGGPALFLANEKVATRLAKAGCLKYVVALFLAGIFIQVAGALMNKVANWYVYTSTLDPQFQHSKKYQIAEWVINQFWVDITIDICTILLFGLAAWDMLTVLA